MEYRDVSDGVRNVVNGVWGRTLWSIGTYLMEFRTSLMGFGDVSDGVQNVVNGVWGRI